ncbi:hypothetical protein NFC81_03800 [Salinispirillum sp. LH 10-3-1]|uniref:Molybdopterin-dependent oxidoreductase n=1 Tax=Salinispirillum sp. LH 10-3-1 TaxID=2952525 RepID=A0AB38YIL1_9GAMM
MKKLVSYLFATTLIIIASPVMSGELPSPTGPVLLTVSGNIQRSNNNGVAEFDREMLLALTQRTISTENPWNDGINTYSGPLGEAIMDAVGVKGTVITVTALNDYSADLPTSDLSEFGVIFAMSMNDKELRVRDRGPLFVIYPFTGRPELNSERYHNRSVWQINRIVVNE